MNVEEQGGNSIENGETTPAATQTDAPDENQEGQGGGDLSNDNETNDKSGEDKDLVRQAQESHRQVIDLIADKFQDLDGGRLTQDQLNDWFSRNPEFAQVANKSKRVKERFRSLMSSKPEAAAKVETDEKKSSDQGEDKPLTRKDLKNILEDNSTQTAKKLMLREREETAEKYAGKYKIQDQDFNRFKTVAEKLYEANDEWDWNDALEASHRALVPSKPKGVSLGGSGAQQNDGGDDGGNEKVDLTKGFTVKSRATE